MRIPKLAKHLGLSTLATLPLLATQVACSGGHAPEIMGLSDQVAQVGTELTIDLDGTDVDGDKLSYDYHAADLTDLAGHAQVTVSPSGAGVFRWTPLAADIGTHAFDFKVSDGSNESTVTINIEVKSAIGSQTAPVFRQPLGTGTTIDLSQKNCVDLDVVVEDQDTPTVKIGQEDPIIDGANLTPKDGQSATWHWCPSRAQEGEDRYTLVLSADDSDNPKTIKNYLVVLRGTGGGGASCPGAPPAISHTPADETTRLDLAPTATVTDDKGIKDVPLFYYSSTNPGATPDLATMTQVSMALTSGDATNGQYTATVPNPVASAAAGTSATIYYVIVADDDDDTMGSCDHSTQSQVYSMTVTAGGSTTAGLCEACSADAQCGDGNECVYVGSMGASYCLQSCASGCATGYSCSSGDIWSVDGAQAPQCVPESGSCEAPQGSCTDDSWEVNDTRSDASANPTLTPDTYDLVSCPSTTSSTRANDDWFKIVVTEDSRVDLQLAGNGETDLDLHLYHSDGTVVSASTSHAADEEISTCLPAATYYVKVNGFGHARSEYLLDYATTAQSCTTTCTDDANEDDDTFSQARATTYPSYASTGNEICPNDDDWYKVTLYAGETMTVDLTFTQATSSEDLDVHLYKDSVDLWPCSPADPSTCDVSHGQGAVSNEEAVFTAPSECGSGCDYDVVVRGWNGSTNAYGITIGIQ